MPPVRASGRLLVALSVAFVVAVAWSAVAPHHRVDWWLEIATPLAMWALLAATLPWFRFTPLAYVLTFAEMLILVVGAHYTHERVPCFDWLRGPLGWERNHYDRFAHFAVGALMVIPARELLARGTPLRGRWLGALSVVAILAWAGAYEILEWWIAIVASPDAAEAYLGSQGDPWDAQKDMLLDTCGAVAGLVAFRRLHDRQC